MLGEQHKRKIVAYASNDGVLARIREHADLLEIAHDAFYVRDQNGIVMHWARSAEDVYGYRADQAVGRNAHDLLDTRFPIPREELEAELRENGVWEGELRQRRANGNEVIVLSRKVLLPSNDGTETILVVDLNSDVTERAIAEQALRDSEERRRLSAEAAGLCTWMWIPATNETIWSEQCGSVFGFPETQMKPLKFVDFLRIVHAEDRVIFQEALDACVTNGTAYEVQFKIVRPDGHERWLEARGRASSSTDAPIRVYGVMQDITERRETEGRLQLLTQELEHLVERRTAELATANEELESFSYTVAHDLRSPLRAIASTSRMLEEDYHEELSAPALNLLKRQSLAARRMSALIDDLLAMSRVSRQSLHLVGFDLSVVAEEVAEAALQTGGWRNMTVFVEPKMHCLADPRLVRVLLQNLIDNACKFSQPQGGTVRVGQFQSEAGTVYFVQDEGSGFDMAYVDKLFQPFQRLHREEDYPGTGIGLATVRRVVERHGGQVWAQSAPGENTTFYFTLASLQPKA